MPEETAELSLYKPRKLGCYLPCDVRLLEQALAAQQQLSGQGISKRLGAILREQQSISREAFWQAIQAQRLDRLRQCRVFTGLLEHELSSIGELVKEHSIPAGVQFIRQDEPGDRCFVLAAGQVEVFQVGPDGEEIILTTVGPGECIGELGYFSDGRRTASVRALDDVELLELYYADLQRAFDLTPKLAKNFLDLVTSRLRRTNFRFQTVVQHARTVERSLHDLSYFLDMSDLLHLRVSIEGLIERVVNTAGTVMQAERASLFLLDVAAGMLWSKVAQGEGCNEIRLPLGLGVVGWAVQHDELVNIPDAYADPRFQPSVDASTGYRTRSILCGPVKNFQGEIIGVLEVINKHDGLFTSDDEALFRAFTYQTAIALENFLLYQRIVASHEKVAILLDVAISAAQTLDLDALMSNIVAKISEVLEAERSSLFLLDPSTDELWSKEAEGTEGKEIRFPRTLGLAGHVASTGQVLHVRDAYEDPRFNPVVDRATGFRTRSVLCAPVRNRDGTIIGVTQAINKRGAGFSQDDEDLLLALSSHLAVALENAQLYERSVTLNKYLVSVSDSLSNGLLTLDQAYRVVQVNRAALALFGQDIQTLLRQDIRHLVGPANACLVHLVDKVYSTHKETVEDDTELILNGKTLSLNLRCLPLVDAKNAYQGLIVVFEDISREKRVRATLVRYMARDIVEKVLEDPTRQALGGIRNKATVVFADIRGFTSMTETLSAEQTVDFLNDYFSRMVDGVFKHRGGPDNYMGDALMAVFEERYVQPDDAVRAVRTALDMLGELAGVNRRRLTRGQPEVHIGIGMSSGEVIAGNIGSEKRMEFTVIGDDVNVASRLEGLNKAYGTGILLSDSTYKEVHDAFVIRPIDRVLVRGRQHPVETYEVLGEPGYRLSRAQASFCEGLDAYRRRDFAKASQLFRTGAGADRPCQIFLARCLYLLEEPPGEDWDGVWIWSDKN